MQSSSSSSLSRLAVALFIAVVGLLLGTPVYGQRGSGTGTSGQNDTLGLGHGFLPLATRYFAAELVRNAQVLVSLRPAAGDTGPSSSPSASSSFDFLPRDRITSRARNGQHHWGDVNLRYRLVATAAAATDSSDKTSKSSSPWIDVSSATARKPVTSLPQSKQPSNNGSPQSPENMTVLASADLGPTLSPSAGGSGHLPFTIVREWLDVDGDLGLRFRITYTKSPSSSSSPSGGAAPVLQIGSLGFPAIANSIFTGRSPQEVQAVCSLADPYVGMDAGYLRIAPVSGKANASVLLVTPLRGTRTPFEAYRNLLDEPSGGDGDSVNAYGTQSFEGLYEWQTITAAWADNEWRAGRRVAGVAGSTNGSPWNGQGRGPVTLLQPGDSVEVGLRFSITGTQESNSRSSSNAVNVGPPAVDATLRRPELDMPVVRGVPGYVLPRDLPGKLFVWPPSSTENITVTVHPTDALSLSLIDAANGDKNTTSITPPPLEYLVTPSATAWGRIRVDLTYHMSTTTMLLQTVHYYVTKPAPEAVADLGRFLTTKQLFTDASDPFGRGAASSVLTYDAEAGDVVRQDPRVWIAGLSDEAGAGSYLAAAAKQAALPDAGELAVLVPFVDRVLWGVVQQGNTSSSGSSSNKDPYGVRKSVFFHDTAAVPRYAYNRSIDWTSWTSWTRTQAYATNRAYDYVHVAATYWALYRAARAYPDVFAGLDASAYTAFLPSKETPPWKWYLQQAAETVQRAMATTGAGTGTPKAEHANDGLMGETVFGALLADLQREAAEPSAGDSSTRSFSSAATTIESVMRARARRWAAAAVPFGSEMAWDSTAQEGVHLWATRFGDGATAHKAVETVVGFTPAVPHWGWNGNARRYWDNKYGGKLQRIERQIHHYGSALNGLVLLPGVAASAATAGAPRGVGVEVSAVADEVAYYTRVGFAGSGTAPLTNIAADGCASASFHSWPDTLAWDAYSGDYGPGFLGMVLGSGTYVVQDTEQLSTGRLLCYGGAMTSTSTTTTTTTTAEKKNKDRQTITVHPRDAWQRRIFVGPLGLLVSIDAGIIESFSFLVSESSRVSSPSQPLYLTIRQREGAPRAAATVVWLESMAANYTVVPANQSDTDMSRSRGGWRVPLQGTAPVTITITPS